MDTQQQATLTLVIDAVVALGTLGALIAALAAMQYERTERRRSEVFKVRSWLAWKDPSTGETRTEALGSFPAAPHWYPIMNVENASDEFIYDVDVTLWPTRSGDPQFAQHEAFIAPGATITSEMPLKYETLATFMRTDRGGVGLELLFRDARGRRWNRAMNGRLRRLKEIKWFTPWRVPHPTESSQLPWFALRAKWRARWRNQTEREHAGLPPRWWAVDILWHRWRYARIHDPVLIPWWKPLNRWRERHVISARRRQQHLPIPLWAIDDWWRDARLRGRHSNAENRRQRQLRRDERREERESRAQWKRMNR